MDNHIDEGTFPGKMMRYVSQVTAMIRHGNFFNGEISDMAAVNALRTNYQALKDGIMAYKEYLRTLVPEKDVNRYAFDAQNYYLVQRLYTFALTVGIILGCVLSAIDTEDTELESDLNTFANGIMTFAEEGKKLKPLGASYVQLCFQAAWVGTTDPSVKAEAEKEMIEYVDAFGPGYTKARLMAELDRMSRHLRLIEPYSV